jgi:RNase H-fold protein (predicted Holliday junction resolvase)
LGDAGKAILALDLGQRSIELALSAPRPGLIEPGDFTG